MCPATLNQFLLTSLLVLGKEKRPNLCGNVLYMPFFRVFGWSIILALSIIDFRTIKFCGIGSGVWLLLGVMHILFLEEFPSQTC